MSARRMLVIFTSLALGACFVPPPKIPAIPPSGLAVRVHVFGASAEDARRSFEAVKENNPSFSVVSDGGDGEILVGLEEDSPKCVAPTALCLFRVAYRVRDTKGQVLVSRSTTVSASASRCGDLCAQALNQVVVKVVEAAAQSLEQGALPPALSAKNAPTRKEHPLCSVGPGPHLRADEAERRAAQVEALNRMNVLDPEDYECLRKSYLERL